jgi:succinate dehydrogenase flavin-adding protein (antitoxin of CptAB toxin-antitoxin module)
MKLDVKDFRGLSRKIGTFTVIIGFLSISGILIHAYGYKPWGYDASYRSIIIGYVAAGIYLTFALSIILAIASQEKTAFAYHELVRLNKHEIEELDLLLNHSDEDLSRIMIREINWRGQHIPVELTDLSGIRHILNANKAVAQKKINDFERPKRREFYSLFRKLFFYKGDAFVLIKD